MSPTTAPGKDRRAIGLIRIPFVRPCSLELDDGTRASACLVNLSVLGAYVSHQDPFAATDRDPPLPPDLPRLGQSLRLGFRLDSGDPIRVLGRASWVNPRQQHPVHSLPPGFGLQFQPLGDRERIALEGAVRTYLATHPESR